MPDSSPAESRPYTVLSCAVSLDGYLDDASDHRLVLSGEADLDQVDELRAHCDAILVGASTIRRDNPRLLVRDRLRRDLRVRRGLPPSPTKVTVTASGDLDPRGSFFTTGDAERLVYCATPAVSRAQDRFGAAAEVVDGGDPVDLAGLTADLQDRGITRLLVEGGAQMLTAFLAGGLADELRLAVAPVFVEDPRAPRFVGAGAFPWDAGHRAQLIDVQRVGDVAVLRYALSDRFADDVREPVLSGPPAERGDRP